MSEFENLEKKAQAYVEEHPEQADKAINEAGEFAERETDHQHDEQIDRAVNAAEQHISQDQGNQQQAQDDQNQQSGREPGP
jgi:antitoxin protein of toxin-antitoxin system